jgi:crotonobetaine/carnitine-CoA ligase
MQRISSGKVLPQLIAQLAAETPGHPLLHEVETGKTHTYAQVHAAATAWADALEAQGVQPDDKVLTMMSSDGGTWLAVWLGVARIGAVDTPVHSDFRGPMLNYVACLSQARIIIVDGAFADRFTTDVLAGSRLEIMVIIGEGNTSADIRSISAQTCLSGGRPSKQRPAMQPWDTACMMLTSGTTGPSKYVVQPWGLLYYASAVFFDDGELNSADVIYAPLPVYHASLRYYLYSAARAGASLATRRRFSLSAFWADVRNYKCTVGAIFPFVRLLWDQPPRESDRDNPMRWITLGPGIANYREFAERFNVRIRSGYGMTEISAPLSTGGDMPLNASTTGRIRTGPPGFELRIVDEYDQEVPVGEVGELIVRTSEPWALMNGYFSMPEATARVWRNGWFHTGDGFKKDHDGNYYFVDRVKDAIRRRGENISSLELEAMVAAHPAIRECAAVAFPAVDEEDEVRLFVVRRDETLTAAELFEDLKNILPRFMLPRYIQFIDELPRTEASLRVKKSELRKMPLGLEDDVGRRR